MKMKNINLHCEDIYESQYKIDGKFKFNTNSSFNNEIAYISLGNEYRQKVTKNDELKLSKLIETLRYNYESIQF